MGTLRPITLPNGAELGEEMLNHGFPGAGRVRWSGEQTVVSHSQDSTQRTWGLLLHAYLLLNLLSHLCIDLHGDVYRREILFLDPREMAFSQLIESQVAVRGKSLRDYFGHKVT